MMDTVSVSCLSGVFEGIGACARITLNADHLVFVDNAGSKLVEVCVNARVSKLQLSPTQLALHIDGESTSGAVITLKNAAEVGRLIKLIDGVLAGQKKSKFDERTEEASASQYFQFYGYLSQQQNMMQDYVRTATYQRAILHNAEDFRDKVVLDVGAGSGILSFFAMQAGARRVYAVEASSMALHCKRLVEANHASECIKVIAGKIEDIDVPEPVDMIISEPMGYMLLNERMLETYLHAKKFLKPGGKMFPSIGDLHMAPFTDEQLYLEQASKANFWCQNSFHGLDLTSLRQNAVLEYFKQPVVDTWHVGILLAESHKWSLDFGAADESELYDITIPVSFDLSTTAFIHGIAFWFDVAFVGKNHTVWLSTAPTEPLTHWYQVRCLLHEPILGRQGSKAVGTVRLIANARQSYDVEIELTCDGRTSKSSLDLKNPYFRYTGQPVMPPPGNHTASPSDTAYSSYYANTALTNQLSNGLHASSCDSSSQQHQQQQQQQMVYANGVHPQQQQQQQPMQINNLPVTRPMPYNNMNQQQQQPPPTGRHDMVNLVSASEQYHMYPSSQASNYTGQTHMTMPSSRAHTSNSAAWTSN